MQSKHIRILLVVVMLFLPVGHAIGQELELLFPVYKKDQGTNEKAWGSNRIRLEKPKEGEAVDYEAVKLTEFVKKFEQKGYRVDQIELRVEGTAESGKLTSLVVSLEGKGGCKITLKPQGNQ
jgi:hypothetical protein